MEMLDFFHLFRFSSNSERELNLQGHYIQSNTLKSKVLGKNFFPSSYPLFGLSVDDQYFAERSST